MAFCEACQRGDHANCGMQSWCECTNPSDGEEEGLPTVEPESLRDTDPSELAFGDEDQ